MDGFWRDVVAIALGVVIGGVILIIGCEYFEIYKFVAPPNQRFCQFLFDDLESLAFLNKDSLNILTLNGGCHSESIDRG